MSDFDNLDINRFLQLKSLLRSLHDQKQWPLILRIACPGGTVVVYDDVDVVFVQTQPLTHAPFHVCVF